MDYNELVKNEEIKEIIRLAFWKYRLSGKKSMNTYIFSEAKKNYLTDDEMNSIIDILEIKIKEYKEKKEQQDVEDLMKDLIIKGLD